MFYKRVTGNLARSRGDAQMRCPINVGKRIMARDPDHPTATIHTLFAFASHCSTLGKVEITRAIILKWNGEGST